MSLPTTPPLQFVDVQGLRTAHLIFGEGTPVIALHGWGANIRLMQPLAEPLAVKGFRVHVLDLPGFGETLPPPSVWSVTDYANFVLAYLDTQELTTVNLIGHSFGGRISLVLGALYADQLRKIVLIDSAGVPPKRSLSSRVRLSAYKTFRDTLYKLGANSTADSLRAWYGKRYGSADFQSAGVLRDTFVKVVNEDLRPYASKIRLPTLMLWGENDQDTPLWQAKELEQLIPDAGLVTFPNAGHYSYLEHLAETVRIIDHFFHHD